MRFCLVSTQEHWGGGEALLSSVGRELARKGHGVSWIVRGGGQVEQRVVASGALVLHATRQRGLNARDWGATRRALANWSPDVVLLNDSHAVPLVGVAARLSRAPRPLRLAYKHTIFRLHSPLKYRWLTDCLVCVSQAAREVAIRGGLGAGHSVVIHGGCEPVHPDPGARHRVRASLGLSDERPLLLCIGSLLACKGHADLLNAMPQVLQQFPAALLIIAGEGEQRPALESLIARHNLRDHVRLLGYRSDDRELINAADLIVHPSHAEGLSLVLIQAQMLRKPIVATAVGGTREVLASDSPSCSSWIARQEDIQSLAQQICHALKEISGTLPAERQAAIEASAQRMFSEFTVESTAEQFIELSARLLDRS